MVKEKMGFGGEKKKNLQEAFVEFTKEEFIEKRIRDFLDAYTKDPILKSNDVSAPLPIL